MKNIKFIPKINSIHFGAKWISISILIGLIIPLLIMLVCEVFLWPLCIVGGVGLLAFIIIFAIEMHQDFGKTPYYQRRLLEDISFDRKTQVAVIKCSICNGEQIVGFKNVITAYFTGVMVIRTEDDLRYFKKLYEIENIKKEY